MDMPEDFSDLGEFAALMAATQGNLLLKSLIKNCPNFIKNSKSLHPVKLASTFGALLTHKKFQKNCLRLEALVHLSLANADGSKAPTSNILIQGYNEVGVACGYLEDPPEDIFVGNICSKEGNYLVLEGIWESSTFYLQRVVNLVDKFPVENKSLQKIYQSVHALLKLSNLVCLKASLYKNELGSENFNERLSNTTASNSFNLRSIVRFSTEELLNAGIDKTSLSPFVFDPLYKEDLLEQNIGNSLLELKPVAFDDDDVYLILPTAISSAIRRFALNRFKSESNRELFLWLLSEEYADLFNTSPLLGEGGGQIKFGHMPWGLACGIGYEQDEGHYIAMFFIMDSLEDFEEEGLIGMSLPNEDAIKALGDASYDLQSQMTEMPDFKSGTAVFISCGIGRGRVFPVENKEVKGWKEVFLSAADFSLLSHTPEMSPLNIWRIENMKDRLSEMNVRLQNINGFLNLYAWAESLNGHLVPHAQMPENHISIGGLNLVVTQNQLIELRHKVIKFIDTHVEQYIDGSWLKVQKAGHNYFEEDNLQPLYIHIPSDRRQMPKGAYVTDRRCWWFEVAKTDNVAGVNLYERSKMLETWMVRAADSLDRRFGSSLGSESILWRCIFEYEQLEDRSINEYGSVIDARNSIKTTVNSYKRIIEFRISEGFDKAIFNPENIAERELVAALVESVATLAHAKSDDLHEVIQEIIPNKEARYSHAFQQREFRDFIEELHDRKLVFINRFDDATTRLGMGWLARDPKEGGTIEGKKNCLQFMNLLVKKLEDKLCEDLRKYNKENLLNAVLLNLESASVSRDKWHRTAAAIIGLRNNRVGTISTMNNYEHRLNGIFQPSRNLLEMIICESLNEGGLLVSNMELSQLMAQAAHLFHFGGWSDLIRWDSMEPKLKVQPLGDVHANHDFVDSVVIPFGNASSEHRYMASVRNYENSLKEPTVEPKADESKMGAFLEAWKADFEVELDAYRRFIDAVENYGIRHKKAILKFKQSELVKLADDSKTGQKIVDSLKLTPRETWRTLPEEFVEKDIFPWRFRRRLSALRLPLLQINNEEDPVLIVSPGLLREGFVSTFRNYYTGSYPDSHLKSAMRVYAGNVRKENGSKFNNKVTNKMIELGWQAQPEIKLTKVLRKSLDRDYGDIDVLAWNTETGRVLIIECKDLQFRKTYGEIAEQLADFRGEINEQGKNDLLKKHLDRVDVIKSHIPELLKFLNLTELFSVESHIVFKNPVPMQFANGPIKELAQCSIFDNLNLI